MTRRVMLLAVLVGALLAGQGTAWAAWQAAGAGTGAGRATALGTAPAPGVSVSGGDDVTVSIAQTSFKGQLLGAYSGGGWRVNRYDNAGTPQTQTSGSTCAGLVSGSAATLTCSEANVPEGNWRYAATPSLGAWRGTEGTRTSVTINTGAPTLVSLQAFDANANGKIDQVVATFSETLTTPYTAGTTPWTLTNVPSNGTLASVAVSGASATLTLNEGTGAATTALGTFKVALAANSGGIRDSVGNQASFAATAPTDKAAPARTAMDLRDIDGNGRIDRVVLTFSETLAGYTAGTTPWTLANVPSGGSLSSVSVSGTTATLTLNEGSGAKDTAVGSATVALATSATGIRDSLGNLSSFAAAAPADLASPVGAAVAGNDGGGTVSRLQTGDAVVLTYSEAIVPGTVMSGWTGSSTSVTVRVTNGNGSTSDSITVRSGSTTLNLGTVDLGRNDYVSGGTVDFAGSTMVMSGSTVTLTLGTPDRSDRITTAAGSGDLAWAPSAGATDAAGNAALTTSVTEAGGSDRDF